MEAVYDVAVNERSVMICIVPKYPIIRETNNRQQLCGLQLDGEGCELCFLICAKISYSTDVLRDR